MSNLIITRGLPGSGKTTWAREWVNSDPATRARVNRDDLRQLMYGKKHGLSHAQENHITAAQHAMVRALTRRGSDVVVDDTTLRDRYVRMWEEFAHRTTGVDGIEFVDFTTPVQECIDRDAQRDEPVGAHTIERLARFLEAGAPRALDKIDRFTPIGKASKAAAPAPEPYVRDDALTAAFIVDIDGTLALRENRSPYDWARVGEDTLNEDVAHVVETLAEAGHAIVYVSGRDEQCRTETTDWLDSLVLPMGELLMRKHGDNRKDSIVKAELFDEHVRDRYAVLGVFDDRNQVVQMWRSMGLTVFQVADGDF